MGLNAGKKLKARRHTLKWKDPYYKRRILKLKIKSDPLGGVSHSAYLPFDEAWNRWIKGPDHILGKK